MLSTLGLPFAGELINASCATPVLCLALRLCGLAPAAVRCLMPAGCLPSLRELYAFRYLTTKWQVACIGKNRHLEMVAAGCLLYLTDFKLNKQCQISEDSHRLQMEITANTAQLRVLEMRETAQSG